jgi:ATP-dependent helicase Lhr and Lhr-like helicase
LREGRIKCVVCTSSLDLGVDFSPVDQVMQIGSPKGIARMMQRAGRSGHQPGAVSRIVGVPTNSLELVEFAAAREAAATRQVESRIPLDRPLDVLVQHLVTLASGDGFIADDLRDEVRATHAFAGLSDAEWQWAMDFVTQGGPALHAYPQYARVTRTPTNYQIASPQIQRLHRMTIGTITSDAAVRVVFVSGASLGTIEESFISRLHPGDRFVFAGRVLELVRVRDMVAHVRKATQRSGIIPRWMGGRSPLSTLLSQAVRRKLDEAREGVYDSLEMQVVRPLLELQAAWSIIPRPNELLIERSHSRDGQHLFVFPFEGRLVHEGLSSLVAHRITSLQARSMHVTANDYGFELLSHEPLDLAEDEWRQVFTTDDLVADLLACLNTTALARRQFREIARVAGLIFPGFPGQNKSARQLQASSQLFFDVFTQFDPSNLLLDQAKREVLDRELEVARLRQTLERILASTIRIIDTPRLTPLGFPIWAERIRTQHITSEKWSDRIQRMVVQLEEAANQPRRATPARRNAKRRTQTTKASGHRQ